LKKYLGSRVPHQKMTEWPKSQVLFVTTLQTTLTLIIQKELYENGYICGRNPWAKKSGPTVAALGAGHFRKICGIENLRGKTHVYAAWSITNNLQR
jgi:hypothetical protein